MYRLTESPSIIIRIADGAHIPADPGNTDYQAYLAWRDAGNDPEPYQPPPATVPQSVTRFQARASLHLAGLLPQVEALMSDPATDPIARIAWQDAQEFRRQSPSVLAMAQALGLSEQQLDQLFTTAASLEA